MGFQDLFNWREKTASRTTANMPAVADEDLAADVDEPPDHIQEKKRQEDFHKSSIRPQEGRKHSLLTQALNSPDTKPEITSPQIKLITEVTRRRSMVSNTSIASTAELTSDGGLTSPARTNTPSPPFPSTTYTSFAPYSLGNESKGSNPPASANMDVKELVLPHPDVLSISPKASVPVVPRKRITFACGGRKDPVTRPAPDVTVAQPTIQVTEAPKRQCKIKFACCGPKPSEKNTAEIPVVPDVPKSDVVKRGARSPSATRKSPRPSAAKLSFFRRSSQSPVAVRCRPKYISADEATLSSEATRFHEFASGELEEDDWIRRELDHPEKKLTINDTLKKENAIRQLGNEAEAEALEEGEDEDDQDGNSSGEDTVEDENDDDDNDDLEGSDVDVSDGNETDNEEGFADSDEESDDDGEFAFWTPGRSIPPNKRYVDSLTYRASANDRSRPSLSSADKIASASSIDSLITTSVSKEERRRPRRKHIIKIRPGTPDLPDSTDFVCGTLDEDRPLEEAYASCMAVKKNAKHKQCPQDIDPSFPTSDIEDEEDEEEELVANHDSDEEVWLHGRFEDSDEERRSRRRPVAGHRKSPVPSPRRLRSPPPPKRLHSPPPTKTRLRSPPPTKTRLRSPPPRKLFGGQSPRRAHSPPPARAIRSPPASPTTHSARIAITFAPLGSRPGLTHTKSLPRTPNAFCRAYRASRLLSLDDDDNDETNDGHIRGAIDIVKGLEHKRQRRKEKYLMKHPRKKNQQPKKPQPGKGAERMREIGLLMAGKPCITDNTYMLSA